MRRTSKMNKHVHRKRRENIVTHHASGVRYWPQLDGLRTIAVIFVLLGHAWTRHFFGATVGVGLFFALSGFLITGLLIKESETYGTVNLLKFSGRRLIRLFPALILMLICTAPVLKPSAFEMFASLFYFSNWVSAMGYDMGAYVHLWSLAVEEQFYLLWPLILTFAYALFKIKGVAWSAAFLILLSTVAKYLSEEENRIYNSLDTRMDNLLVGALLAILYSYYPEMVKKWSRVFSIPGVLIIIIVTLVPESFSMATELTLITWGSVMVVALLACADIQIVNSFMSMKALVWFGAISYGVYLWHYPLQWMWLSQGISYSMRFPLVLVSSVVIAWLSYRFVERPISKTLRPYVTV